MRCLGVVPGARRVEVVERPEPGAPAAGEVLIEMIECGVCGTDRHIVGGGRARPAPGESALVLGHEPLGRVLAVGEGVRHLRPGDLVSATNQRSCGNCALCAAGEVDLCLTAAGSGRGISGMDGFLQPRLLDDAAFCVRVPAELAAVGVLTEPLAVCEKAIAHLRQIQRRLPHTPWTERAQTQDWARGLRFLVGGAGPIGTLAAFALRAHGGEVTVLDRAPADSLKAALLRRIGVHYLCSQDAAGEELVALAAAPGPFDAAFEAAGSGDVCLALWRALERNGALAVVGGAHGGEALLPPGEVFGRALARNQALVGSIASNPRHFTAALEDLGLCLSLFPEAIQGVVSRRWPFDQAEQAFDPGGADDIKRVIRLAPM
jgi:threonine dehydrogenase-like Zn-dependent dehydrogenase